MRSLMRLGHIGRDMAQYLETENRQAQLDALARATGALNGIDAYVSAEVMLPERYVIQRIISPMAASDPRSHWNPWKIRQ